MPDLQPSPCILVIEDDPDVREVITDVLEDAGLHVERAEDGEAGLAALRAGLRPSAVVVDLMMPGMDGWTFLARLRADDELRHLPVLVMTAAGERELGPARTAADAVLFKPASIEEIVHAVRALLGSVGEKPARG